jgi:hypothetical protein
MICGCVFALVKRRKLRVERRRRALQESPNSNLPRVFKSANYDCVCADPAGAGGGSGELAKLGLWWTGGTGGRSDALLNQDYMIGSNATKEGSTSSSSVPPPPAPPPRATARRRGSASTDKVAPTQPLAIAVSGDATDGMCLYPHNECSTVQETNAVAKIRHTCRHRRR